MTISDAPFILSCRAGAIKGQRLEVHRTMTLGRGLNCDIVVDDPKISRHHGTFFLDEGKLFYRDEMSTNGSFLNNTRLQESMLQVGDVVKVGSTEFAVALDEDFRTINFVMGETMVTGVVEADSVQPDALAQKFSQIFDYYKDHQPDISESEQYELVRTQRLLNGLKSLFAIGQNMTRITTLPDLLKRIGENLFEVFAGAENVVILLRPDGADHLEVRYARTREGDEDPIVNISRTVVDEAMSRRSTLIANDAAQDARLQGSMSIIGFSVKSVMCAPLVAGSRSLGALYLDNREENVRYDELDAELVTAFANQCAVAIENAFLCDTLQAHYLQTLQSLVNAIEAKDSYTMGHTARVARYAVGIGRAYGFEESRIERLKLAADLHDIGKIGVSEGIINKAGKLSDTEFGNIKNHVEMGEKILKPISFLRDILPWIRAHHEKWDGSGYPDGLQGEDIPLEGRILALADAFDAMTSKRSYNNPMTMDEAARRIQESSGKHFDPGVVTAFFKYLQSAGTGIAPPTPNGMEQKAGTNRVVTSDSKTDG